MLKLNKSELAESYSDWANLIKGVSGVVLLS